MSIVSQALIVSLAFYIIQNINFVMANPMLNRPLVLCPIIGGLLGDLTTGLLLGASLEVMFLGVINVGGATCADVLALMAEVQRRVKERSGVTLEPEVRVVD